MATTIAEALLQAAQVLRKAGVVEARREAGSLLSFVIERDRTALISHAEDLLVSDQLIHFTKLVDRRALGEPLQYITGKQDFYGREFSVTPAVLIPRPETEILVEVALEKLKDFSAPKICDVGTGSGCIAVSLLCERHDAYVTALDISSAALDVARMNASDHGVLDRVVFRNSDLFKSLDSENDSFDLVVSNPPYIADGVIPTLQREVREHEPLMALASGTDGLDHIRRLLLESPQFLKPQGHLIIEIGFDQSELLKSTIDNVVWQLLEIRPDLQGIPRIAVLRRS
jgi:release factor glutamine methyltransferase